MSEIEVHVPLKRAAELVGLSIHTLHVRLSQGTLPILRAKKILGQWRVPLSRIQARRRRSTARPP